MWSRRSPSSCFVCLVFKSLRCTDTTWRGGCSAGRCTALCAADAFLAQGPLSRRLLLETAWPSRACSACLCSWTKTRARQQRLGQRAWKDREAVACPASLSGANWGARWRSSGSCCSSAAGYFRTKNCHGIIWDLEDVQRSTGPFVLKLHEEVPVWETCLCLRLRTTWQFHHYFISST